MRLRRAAVLLLHTVAMGVDPVRINMSALRGTAQTASSLAHASTAPTFLGRIAHLFSHHTSQAAASKSVAGCHLGACICACLGPRQGRLQLHTCSSVCSATPAPTPVQITVQVAQMRAMLRQIEKQQALLATEMAHTVNVRAPGHMTASSVAATAPSPVLSPLPTPVPTPTPSQAPTFAPTRTPTSSPTWSTPTHAPTPLPTMTPHKQIPLAVREKDAVPYGRGLVAFHKQASGGRHVGAAAAVKKALAVALKRLTPSASLADVRVWQSTQQTAAADLIMNQTRGVAWVIDGKSGPVRTRRALPALVATLRSKIRMMATMASLGAQIVPTPSPTPRPTPLAWWLGRTTLPPAVPAAGHVPLMSPAHVSVYAVPLNTTTPTHHHTVLLFVTVVGAVEVVGLELSLTNGHGVVIGQLRRDKPAIGLAAELGYDLTVGSHDGSVRAYYNNSVFAPLANVRYGLFATLDVYTPRPPPSPHIFYGTLPVWSCSVCVVNAIAMLKDGSTRRVPDMCETCRERTSATSAPTPAAPQGTQW